MDEKIEAGQQHENPDGTVQECHSSLFPELLEHNENCFFRET